MRRQYEEHGGIKAEEDKNPLEEAKENSRKAYYKVTGDPTSDRGYLSTLQSSLDRLKSTDYASSKITSIEANLYNANLIFNYPEDKQKDLKRLKDLLLDSYNILNAQ